VKNEFKRFSDAATAGNAVYTMANDTGRPIKLLYAQAVLTTNGSAADRRVELGIYDADGNTVVDTHAGVVVTASTSDQHLEFMQGVYRETSFIDGTLQVPFGQDWIIPPGWSYRVSVAAGVAGDTYSVEAMAAVL
jgi:hypothetical protein